MTQAIFASITATLGEYDGASYFAISANGKETELAVPNTHEDLQDLAVGWEGMIEAWDRKKAKGPAKENHFRLGKIAQNWNDFPFYQGPDLTAGALFSEGSEDEDRHIVAVERDITAEEINKLAGEKFVAERNLTGLVSIDPAAAHRTRVKYTSILRFLEEEGIVTLHAPLKMNIAWEPGARVTVSTSEDRPAGRRISADEFEEHFWT